MGDKPKHLCLACLNNGVTHTAQFLAAQWSGGPVTWMPVCASHAWGWNAGGDWDAPVVPLSGVLAAKSTAAHHLQNFKID